MIISHKYKIVFIKTRKTAGSSIQAVFRSYLGDDDVCSGSKREGIAGKNCPNELGGHQRYSYILKNYPEAKDYWAFAIERNPWDKCVSAFYWYKHIEAKVPGEFNFTKNTKFEDFVLFRGGSLLPCDWRMYNNKAVSVFKYEGLEKISSLYANIGNKSDLQIPIVEFRNKFLATRIKSGIRDNRDYREMYNNKTRSVVRRIFKNEIEAFGYEFGSTRR